MLGVMLAMLAFVGAASAARTASVNVGDSTLAPARVRVDAGGTVTWRNTGARSHRIASANRAFAAFTLAPRARRSVQFARNGAHRYTVDGRRCGIVYVGVALGPACSTGGGGVIRPPSGTRFYNFDVTLRGMIKNDGFVDSQGRREQTWVRQLTWTSTFRNFRFKVVTGGAIFIGINAVDTFVNSTAPVTETWDYFWHPHRLSPPNADCEGSTSATVPYRMFTTGSSLPPNFRVAGQAPNGWFKDETIKASCNGWTPPTTQAPEFTWNGMRVSADVGTLTMEFERRAGGLTPPVSQLVNGRAFTVDTGTHTSQQTTCEGDCSGTLTITQRYVATFTPRR
jgi:hypothetical protein